MRPEVKPQIPIFQSHLSVSFHLILIFQLDINVCFSFSFLFFPEIKVASALQRYNWLIGIVIIVEASVLSVFLKHSNSFQKEKKHCKIKA